MALRINTQIGTDRGITDEAYVRIGDYQLNKQGSLNLRVEVFQSQDDAVTETGLPTASMNTARNMQIGEFVFIPLLKDEERTHMATIQVPVETTQEVEQPKLDENHQPVKNEDGSFVMETVTRTMITGYEEQTVEQAYTVKVPDLSAVEEQGLFAFAYSKLKEKLADLYGEDNIEDC